MVLNYTNPMYLGQATPTAAPQSPPPPGTEPVEEYDPTQLATPSAVAQTAPATGLPSTWKKRATDQLKAMGVDVTNLTVVGRLEMFDAAAPILDSTPGLFETMLGGVIADLTAQGIIISTPYEDAQQASGFGTDRPTVLGVTTPSEVRGGEVFTTTRGLPVTEPKTGWKQYPSGVLVAPGATLGDPGAVYYPPGSTAPGSSGFFESSQIAWSQDKVNEWRAKLVDMGYLDPGAKKGPWDVGFQNALQTYYTIKYQNGGRELPLEGLEGAPAVTPYNFQQVQGRIRNDIRGQYQRIYGADPTDTELEEWEDFIVKTASQLYRRGQLAPEQAALEAEERFVERLERTPEAQFMIENLEENTGLRDSILRAVQVAQGMSG